MKTPILTVLDAISLESSDHKLKVCRYYLERYWPACEKVPLYLELVPKSTRDTIEVQLAVHPHRSLGSRLEWRTPNDVVTRDWATLFPCMDALLRTQLKGKLGRNAHTVYVQCCDATGKPFTLKQAYCTPVPFAKDNHEPAE